MSISSVNSLTINPETGERITERVKVNETGHYAIRQTSDISDMRMYSGNFSTRQEAENALNDEERAMLGGRVNIVFFKTKSTETIITTETVV